MEAYGRLSPAEVTTDRAKQSWSWLLSVHCSLPSFWQLGGWGEGLACTRAHVPLDELPETTSMPRAKASHVCDNPVL